MLVPLSWLKEFVPVKASPERVAEKLLLSGTKVEEIRKVKGELVFDLEITPNRADTLSILGVAREVAALFAQELSFPETGLLLPKGKQTTKIELKISNKKLISGYSLVKLESLAVKPSSIRIQNYLELSGIRAINNVVDITNFVMLELGQPMHAFDAAKVVGEMSLRPAKKDEEIVTLDGITRKLPEGAIVIEDNNKIIDLAGLMGGYSSQIDERTSEIILLVPVYDSTTIRKTSLQLGFRTEASNRFEKKIDPNLHPLALNRALRLLSEETGAVQSSRITTFGYPAKERQLDFDESLIKKILGIELSREKIFDLLTPLGFRLSVSPFKENELRIQVPSFRNDITIAEDIIEEIGRIFGYNNFPKTLPQGSVPIQTELFKPKLEVLLRESLLNFGYSELTGYSLVSEKDLKFLNYQPKDAVKVLHPTSLDFEYLRPSLLINLIKAFVANETYLTNAFFEIAKEFGSEKDKLTNLPLQPLRAVFANNYSFSKIKGEVEKLLNQLQLNLEQNKIKNDSLWDFGVIFSNDKQVVAKVGKLSTLVVSRFGLENKVFVAWLDLEELSKFKIKSIYQPLAKFPAVFEDVSFFLSTKYSIQSVMAALKNVDKRIRKIKLSDVFEKDGKNSFTLAFEFLDDSKTLESTEVRTLHNKIERTLGKKFAAQIRKD